MNKTLLKFKSRRNQAQLIQTVSGEVVQKVFSSEAGFQQELSIYRRLAQSDLPSASVITAYHRTLTLTRLPGITLVDLLERQEEKQRIDYEIWDMLVDWLVGFEAVTGCVMKDVNLRNFLFDDESHTLYGIDFEEAAPGNALDMASSVAAFVRLYRPENTEIKKQISNHLIHRFSHGLSVDSQTLFHLSKQKEILLLQRRKNKTN